MNSKLLGIFQPVLKLNSNEPIKILLLENLANQSIFNDAFIIEIISNSFYESKINFPLIKKENSDQKRETWKV